MTRKKEIKMANEGKFRRLQCQQAVVGVVNDAIADGDIEIPQGFPQLEVLTIESTTVDSGKVYLSQDMYDELKQKRCYVKLHINDLDSGNQYICEGVVDNEAQTTNYYINYILGASLDDTGLFNNPHFYHFVVENGNCYVELIGGFNSTDVSVWLGIYHI
jgi:hypothetical protein